MITDWPISHVIGGVRQMNGISLWSVPLCRSLGDYTTLASLLGNDLVVGLELPVIRSIGVNGVFVGQDFGMFIRIADGGRRDGDQRNENEDLEYGVKEMAF